MTSKNIEMRPQSIEVNGRRWFRRGPGNTYHSVEIIVDGDVVHVTPYAYGYDDQYLWTARQWLKKNGYLPGIEDYKNGGGESIWRYCERVGCSFTYSIEDVKRKKHLHDPIDEKQARQTLEKHKRRHRVLSRQSTEPHGRCQPDRCLEHEEDPAIKSCR